MRKIIVLVGVPASGKTYVCDRVGAHYTALRHDGYVRGAYIRAIEKAAQGPKPVLAEAPFNAAAMISELQADGFVVEQWLVTGDLDQIKARYAQREGKAYPANFETNYHRYNASGGRFKFVGDSGQVLVALRRLV